MALCLAAGTGAFAQNPKNQSKVAERPTVEQMAQRQTERMTKELGLNEQQAKEVYDINLAQVKQMQAQREQMRAARNAQAEKMKSILTTEQFVKWSQLSGPMPGSHRDKMHRGDRKDGTRNGRNCDKPCSGKK